MRNTKSALTILLASALFGAALTFPQTARAHCDTMDGPVAVAAKAALEQKDVTPVLKWVKPDAESEIKSVFAKTVAVRSKGPEARELADQYFFETLVRVHRAGEGAPFTGLKPAGTPLGSAIEEADLALESGFGDKLVKLVTDQAAAGIQRRLAEAREKKAHAGHDVKAGREFVAAYVEYVHYVEGLHQAAQAIGADHGDAAEAAPETANPQDTQHQH